MKSSRQFLLPLVSVFVAVPLAGCVQSHEMSLEASCREYAALSRGDTRTAAKDIKNAAPHWHEAVAEPALVYWDALERTAGSSDMTDEAKTKVLADAIPASERLFSLCRDDIFTK